MLCADSHKDTSHVTCTQDSLLYGILFSVHMGMCNERVDDYHLNGCAVERAGVDNYRLSVCIVESERK